MDSATKGFSLLEVLASISILSTLLLLSLPGIRAVIGSELRLRLQETRLGRLESAETFVRQNILKSRALSGFDGFATAGDRLEFQIPDLNFFFRVFDYSPSTDRFRSCLVDSQVSSFAPLQANYDRYIAFSKEGYLTLGGNLKRAAKNGCSAGTEYSGNLKELTGGMSWKNDASLSATDLVAQAELLIPLETDLKLWTDASQTLRRSFSGSASGQPMNYGFGDLKVYPQKDGSVELRFSSPKSEVPDQRLFVPKRLITQGELLDELY